MIRNSAVKVRNKNKHFEYIELLSVNILLFDRNIFADLIYLMFSSENAKFKTN